MLGMQRDVTDIDHPLVDSLLTKLRDADTRPAAFRRTLRRIAQLMAFELTRDLETAPLAIRTPLVETMGRQLAHPVALVPILRAGLGMLDGFLEILPDAKVGHIGMARDEQTHRPESYYCKLPADIADSEVFLIDPMLATGRSGAAAASQLKQHGASRLRFVNLVASPEGVAYFHGEHPEIPIYTAAIDERLDRNAYILPGLGDAGDRYFGTL